jgi:hypothetical protein
MRSVWVDRKHRDGLDRCPRCASTLTETEIFAIKRRAFPRDAASRLVESRAGFWDHDHCLTATWRLVGVCRSATVNPRSLMGRIQLESGSVKSVSVATWGAEISVSRAWHHGR